MSRKYIPINTIADIDLSKVSLATIDNRYIDKNGNRFATRFNIRNRKIQIVRIALGTDEAINSKGKIVKELLKKREHFPEQDQLMDELIPQTPEELEAVEEKKVVDPSYARLPKWIQEKEIPFLDSVDPGKFVATLPEVKKTISERIFGIINTIEKSDLYDNFQGFDPVMKFHHIFDDNINTAFTKAEEIISEFSKYPKTPEHYLNNIEIKHHDMIEQLEGEEQMNVIKSYMICHSLMPAMEGALQITEFFREVVSTIDKGSIPEKKIQTFEDNLSSARSIEDLAREKISQMITWMREEKLY